MSNGMNRRDFLKNALAAIPASAVALDWDALPRARQPRPAGGPDFDAVVIGSGLAGLSCAAAFARQGYKPLVLERHMQPGGFATTFTRPGGFTFDVSLHSTGAGERNGVRNLIDGFPEITDVEFLPHPNLMRAIFPDYDIRVAQRDPAAFEAQLVKLFPHEKAGIAGLFADIRGLGEEIAKFGRSGGKVDMATFGRDYPVLSRAAGKTWGAFVDFRVRSPRLKAIVSSQWGYYGLPPSRLSVYYYALPFWGYLTQGGFYPKGGSRAMSQALVKLIRSKGGEVRTSAPVAKITVDRGAATGVVLEDGTRVSSRVVVSNANPHDTFGRMIDDPAPLADYRARMARLSVSISSFQVWLGLKKDLLRETQFTDSEVFFSDYDHEAGYRDALDAQVEGGGFGLTAYDNVVPGCSPAGKNTLSLMVLQGYDHWAPFEADYKAGNKDAYNREKERMADALIDQCEQTLLPGLRAAIEVKEIGTPLTNVRYTGHTRGAIYGWDQTVDNSGPSRVGHKTPIRNLWLAGAWSNPGHGYGAVIPSGLECFGEIMKDWPPKS